MNELVALVAFAFVGTVSPGPNNTVLWVSGLRFGFRPTIPHIVGTALGIGTLVVGVAAGIGALLEAVPAASMVLKLVGSAYLLYVAVLVLGSGGIGGTEVSHPLNLWHAIGFQCVNPKAWIFAVAAVGTFLSPSPSRFTGIVLLTGTLMVVVVGSSSIWAAGGAALGRVVDDERTRRVVSIALAALLVASVVLIWILAAERRWTASGRPPSRFVVPGGWRRDDASVHARRAGFALLLLLSTTLVACTGSSSSGSSSTTVPTGSSSPEPTGSSSSPAPPEVAFTGGGWSFGECSDNCVAQAVIAASGDVEVRISDGGGERERRYTGTLTAAGLASVAAFGSIDVGALDPVYGCPDCTDGGAGHATWLVGSDPFTVAFDYGRPPRALRAADRFINELIGTLWHCSDDASITATPPFRKCSHIERG